MRPGVFEEVRLVQDREARLAALDASIARPLANVDAGRMKPAEDVFERLATRAGLDVSKRLPGEGTNPLLWPV